MGRTLQLGHELRGRAAALGTPTDLMASAVGSIRRDGESWPHWDGLSDLQRQAPAGPVERKQRATSTPRPRRGGRFVLLTPSRRARRRRAWLGGLTDSSCLGPSRSRSARRPRARRSRSARSPRSRPTSARRTINSPALTARQGRCAQQTILVIGDDHSGPVVNGVAPAARGHLHARAHGPRAGRRPRSSRSRATCWSASASTARSYTDQKFNATYAVGGPDLVLKVVKPTLPGRHDQSRRSTSTSPRSSASSARSAASTSTSTTAISTTATRPTRRSTSSPATSGCARTAPSPMCATATPTRTSCASRASRTSSARPRSSSALLDLRHEVRPDREGVRARRRHRHPRRQRVNAASPSHRLLDFAAGPPRPFQTNNTARSVINGED